MVFHWRLRDSKSPQVSRTRLSILAVLNNTVVWMVSTRPSTSKSSRPFNNPLVTVPKAPITIGTIVTFMFHSFFNSLARSMYLSLFSHSFSFILWSAGTAKTTILQIFFFFFLLLIIIRSGFLAEIRWSVCISKSHWSLSDSKFPQVSRTLLGILSDLSNTVVWIVSARSPISKSSGLFTKPLGISPITLFTIDITVVFIPRNKWVIVCLKCYLQNIR